MGRMERIILILLSLLLLTSISDAIKKKYLDTDMDGINDEEDEDDDNDGIDEDEDEDADGIPNGEDSDDDGDGVSDDLEDDDKVETPAKTKGKGNSGSGPWGKLVFGYYFGLTHYILKTA